MRTARGLLSPGAMSDERARVDSEAWARESEPEEMPMTAKKKSTRRSSPAASHKVEKAVHEQKEGTLRTGSGKKVTSRKQAVAIGLSEARKSGAKVPKRKSSRG